MASSIAARCCLRAGVAMAGAMSVGAVSASTGAAAEPLANDPWSLAPGVTIPPYGQPSRFEAKTIRTLSNPKLEPRNSAARTPHHLLNGTITPNGLHFVIAREGFPEIDPDKHKLLIHGRVRQPMTFTVGALMRYPMVSRVTFLECGGNSAHCECRRNCRQDATHTHG
jgi:sulfane dehydrogenase subunit SoxC